MTRTMKQAAFEQCVSMVDGVEIYDLTKAMSAIKSSIQDFGRVRWIVFPYETPPGLAFSMRSWLEYKLSIELELLEPDDWLTDWCAAGV